MNKMLLQLRIKDFAIIDGLELHFGPGMNVLTGETGAGKSIIIEAAELLRGGRSSPELVRSGAAEAVVEAIFDLSRRPQIRVRLREAGLPAEGLELLVRRVIPADGRSRVYINGAMCTAALLAELTAPLLEISGQHEHQLLQDRSMHRQLLDAFGLEATAQEAMSAAYDRLAELAQARQRSEQGKREQIERLEFLRFQLRELEDAQLVSGEEAQLESEQRRLARARELIVVAGQGEQLLYSDDDSVGDRLSRFRRQLDELLSADEELVPIAAQLDEAAALIEDAAGSLRRYGQKIETDPERLAQVEERLDLLRQLQRKHGRSIGELIARREELRVEIGEWERLEEKLGNLESDLREERARAEKQALELSKARQTAARKMSAAVSEQLGKLRMAGARFLVDISTRPARENDDSALCFGERKLAASGWDRVEFLIATNRGEDPRPLLRIASGGELSRIMLAIATVLGAHDPVCTSIYDEVDAGISGAVADVVGRLLSQAGRHRQVLCVTHLPQVAAYAERHYQIQKVTIDERTRTQARQLTAAERVEELARLLGAAKVTKQARANAAELLQAAQRPLPAATI